MARPPYLEIAGQERPALFGCHRPADTIVAPTVISAEGSTEGNHSVWGLDLGSASATKAPAARRYLNPSAFVIDRPVTACRKTRHYRGGIQTRRRLPPDQPPGANIMTLPDGRLQGPRQRGYPAFCLAAVALDLPLPGRPQRGGLCIGHTSFFTDQIVGSCRRSTR